MIWYGYHPRFTPPLQLLQTTHRRRTLVQLNCLRSEVTASLKLAAEVMKRPHPVTSSVLFKEGDLVWLEGTNIHTTHPKAKLAPKRHGPFKVLTTWVLIANCSYQQHGESTQYSTTPSCLHTKKPLPMVQLPPSPS